MGGRASSWRGEEGAKAVLLRNEILSSWFGWMQPVDVPTFKISPALRWKVNLRLCCNFIVLLKIWPWGRSEKSPIAKTFHLRICEEIP